MNSQNDNKRLVLIGIRRKGEQGFRKRIDSKISLDQSFSENEALDLSHPALSNSSQILNLLPD